MFNFLAATTAPKRMDELGRFLEFWYGPRRPEYGEPEERLRRLKLPDPLRHFYRFAGRWPSSDSDADQFFYSGNGGHHLRDLDGLRALPDGRLNFFMEYQGDWDGLTLQTGEDPPVWIEGFWDEDEDEESDEDEEGRRKTKQVSDSLSKFLVTHCLMTTAYDYDNSALSSSDERLEDWFRRDSSKAVRIWDAGGCSCPNYEGEFFLFHRDILVHRTKSGFHQFAALHPAGVELLNRHLAEG